MEVRMDEQGRIVIPAEIRNLLRVKRNSRFSIRVEGSKIILEPVFDFESAVDEWVRVATSTKLEVMSEEVENSWKWIGKEYAERKLGLQ
ncbi:MAG: AbrB/MazE/SpoVT family DNA-binding domain-containing protein [Candidatus Jordarchaeales archaeon]